MKDFFKRFRREDGQAMVEYGIIIALVSVAAIALLAVIGTDVQNAFSSIAEELAKVAP